MRRIFTPLPYFLPPEPEPFRKLFLEHGTLRRIEKGETLKRGGDDMRLFLLEEGLCAYYAGQGFGRRPIILSTILPGRTMGDMTAAIGSRCNVFTRALTPSTVRILAPVVLQDAIEADPALARLEIRNVIAKEESLVEGMVANFTRAPRDRLIVFCKVFIAMADADRAAGRWRFETPCEREMPGFRALPIALSAKLIGEALNLNRVSVAKIWSGLAKAGLAARRRRRVWIAETLLAEPDDWLAERPEAAG